MTTIQEKRKQLALVHPSFRQLAWQKMEYYAFFHFGMNTFTGKEWGDGKTPAETFAPETIDVKQWVETLKAAGMKGAILTCKHHDGFCLWPSEFTDYSVKNSPYKNGQGDVVKELSEALRQAGLKFGVYLSPWDRHEKTYGTYSYNDYFCHQLTELLTNYGDIFTVWFDGACGEGPNGKKQVYDWQRYYDLIRQLQPEAVINVTGPDVRWIGNEAGQTRSEEWSVLPHHFFDQKKIQAASQQEDDEEFRQRYNTMNEDLGSFAKVKDETDFIWYPAEVDVSIRPGWFYHKEEDDQVKTLSQLRDIYLASVGGNASLLLNIPPAPNGKIATEDVTVLEKLGQEIREFSKANFLEKAQLTTNSLLSGDFAIENIKTKDASIWIGAEDQEEAVITLEFPEETTFNMLEIQEALFLGQRIESFKLEAEVNHQWVEITTGTTVGYKKICRLQKTKATNLRLTLNSRWHPHLSYLGLYHYDFTEA